MKRAPRQLMLAAFALTVVALIVYFLIPAPVAVDLAVVARAPMRVTVDEDGRTRIKERYVVSAPLTGRLARTSLKAGDPVEAGKTIVATIDPVDPSLLDPRARAQAEARVKAAEAALERAGATFAREAAALELAQTELARVQSARGEGASTAMELDDATISVTMRTAEHRASAFARDIARFELDQARAALLHATPRTEEPAPATAEWTFEIASPVNGRVLRVFLESASIVSPGTQLIELGDPADLELEVDVLSSDAVGIRPGAAVSLEQWGGEAPLRGVVRLVEPAGFTKVSALGVEEQRVNVIIDFVDMPQAREGLGDGFRVEARIVVWEHPDVLRVPVGALFRHGESWAVFEAEGAGRTTHARLQPVTIGRRNALEAEVISGLSEDARVVVYPGDKVTDGARIAPRIR